MFFELIPYQLTIHVLVQILFVNKSFQLKHLLLIFTLNGIEKIQLLVMKCLLSLQIDNFNLIFSIFPCIHSLQYVFLLVSEWIDRFMKLQLRLSVLLIILWFQCQTVSLYYANLINSFVVNGALHCAKNRVRLYLLLYLHVIVIACFTCLLLRPITD